jgi:hypothetical protein
VSAVFERYLDLDYPSVVRGEGVRLYLEDGRLSDGELVPSPRRLPSAAAGPSRAG